MAEITHEVAYDLMGIFTYTMGFFLMFVILFVLAYTMACVWRMVHIIITIKTNLYADKLEERAQRDFEDYCKERDNG